MNNVVYADFSCTVNTSPVCEWSWVTGLVEGGEVLGVGVGEGVEVLLGGGDLGMAHPVHHGFEVGSAGEQPGRMGMAEVVNTDLEVHARGGHGGAPDPGAEGVARDRCALTGGEQQVTRTEPTVSDVRGELGEEVVGEGHGAGFVVFGVGLGEHPVAGGGVLDRDLDNRLLHRQASGPEIEVAGGLSAMSSPQRTPVLMAASIISRCCSGRAAASQSPIIPAARQRSAISPSRQRWTLRARRAVGKPVSGRPVSGAEHPQRYDVDAVVARVGQ